ncbi:DUF4334 domain-containing protein [Sanguibacter sp. YZGR15]|uniref:DUF4334 domain-containing protein n=1 Tax=Sanguibacter suaedae TaxID=2795737 RepID=A0A934M8N0_9MICO|nr:DUF4334 domain-containing protein [Sanguibacter suaedae]
MVTDAPARLRVLEAGTTPDAALAFFDTLPPVAVDDLIGAWRGSGVPTGHPFDGALERLGWHGKRFEDAERAHPLVFRGRGDRLVRIDPRLLPLGAALRMAPLLRTRAAGVVFAAVRPLLTTTHPQARVRAVEHRGVVTAAMVYDRQPIIDAFRRVDAHTLLGVMDLRGMGEPYVFVLRRQRSRDDLGAQ